MVGGAGTEGLCLGSAFCLELSEVVLYPWEPPFAKEGKGRGALETGWMEVVRKRVWVREQAEPSLGPSLGWLQTLGLRLEGQALGGT